MTMVGLDELREYIGTTGTAKDSLLEACLDSAEREVLNFCQRSSEWTGFEASTGTRYYRADSIIRLPGEGGGFVGGFHSWDRWGATYPTYSNAVLWLGDADLLSVDTLTNGDGLTLTSTQYWLEPRNKRPYHYVRLKTGYQWIFQTDSEISIEGTWGFSTGADPEIKDFVKQTARYKLDLRTSQVFDVTASPEIGVLTIPKGIPANVKLGLSQGGYRRGSTRPIV